MPKLPARVDYRKKQLLIGFAFALAGMILPPICIAQTPRTSKPGKPTVSNKPFTDPAALKKALDYIESSGETDRVKEIARSGVIEEFNKERAIADLEYRDNLKKATDAWYANGKDWKKIPPNVWEKLREADRGRLKSGIDPELQPSAQSSPAIPNPDHPSPPRIPSIPPTR